MLMALRDQYHIMVLIFDTSLTQLGLNKELLNLTFGNEGHKIICCCLQDIFLITFMTFN